MLSVFDCNILISAALFPDSIPGRAMNLALEKGKIISSFQTLSELRKTLNKPKLKKYLTIRDKLSFFSKFESISEVAPITQEVTVCRDPKDNMYLELALSGNADFIVTGDNDLLVLNPFRNIPVITPNYFLEYFKS